jgi:hypothetical protein
VDESTFLAACRSGRPVELDDNGTAGELDADLIRRTCGRSADQVDPRGIRLRNAVVAGPLDLSGVDVPFPIRFENCRFESALLLDGARLRGLAVTNCEVPGLLANGVRVRRDLDLSGSRIVASHRTSASTSRGAAVWLCESQIGGRVLCVDTVIDGSGDRAVQADRMRVGGTIRLIHDFTARGEVRLLGVRVHGSVDLTGAHLDQPVGLALDLADTTIGGSVFLIGATNGRKAVVRGRIGLNAARISGHLMVRDAELSAPLREPANGGYTRRLEAGTALSAPRLSVTGEVSIEGDSVISGGLDLSGADLGAMFVEDSCRLRAAGRTAIDLTHAQLRSNLVLNRAVIEGSLRITGCHIHGNVSLRDATMSQPERASLVAGQGATVDGDVTLTNLHVIGGRVSFRSASLGSVLDAGGAKLINPTGQTLSLHQATVGGSVRLVDGFTSTGAVVLTRSTIEGRLDCRDGVFECPAPGGVTEDGESPDSGHAILAFFATVRGGMFLNWARVTPSVAFVDAVTTVLVDDPTNWPERFAISGLSYGRFAEPTEGHAVRAWDWRLRCAWLRRQTVFDAGPYEQVARVFRQHGYATQAEEILINQRTEARRAAASRRPGATAPGDGMVSRAWRLLEAVYGWTVAYGYRPGRVLWMLVALLLAVLLSVSVPVGRGVLRAADADGDVYTPAGALVTTNAGAAAHAPGRIDVCGDGQVRCFQPIFFAIDTVVPLVSMGQRDTWYADTEAPWGEALDVWLEVATLAGWLLSSVFVLSFTRLARSAA